MCGCTATATFDSEAYKNRAYADPPAGGAVPTDPISAIAKAAGDMFNAYGKVADIFGKKEERKREEEITEQVRRNAQAQEYLATIGLQTTYAQGQNQFSDNLLKLKREENTKTPTAVYVVGILAIVLVVMAIIYFRK